MQIASALAGFTLGEADILRKAMGKKKADVMATQKDQFLKGCATRGVHGEEGPEDLGPDGAVRRLRLQQVALGGLRLARVPDRLPEGEPPGVLHGGAAHLGAREHRQDGAATSASAARWASACCRRTSTSRTCSSRSCGLPMTGKAAADGSLPRERRCRSPEHSFRSGRDQERGRGRGRGGARGAPRRRALQLALRLLRARRLPRREPARGGELRQERHASTRWTRAARRSTRRSTAAMESGQKRQRDRE